MKIILRSVSLVEHGEGFRHGFEFADLYRRDGLVRVDELFCAHVGAKSAELLARLEAARRDPISIALKDHSALIIELASHLDDFVAEFFGIADEVTALRARHAEIAPRYNAKRQFVQRKSAAIKPDAVAAIDGAAITAELETLLGEPVNEPAYAAKVNQWLAAEAEHAKELEVAARYAAWAVQTPAGRERHAAGTVFRLPTKVDPTHLVPSAELTIHGAPQLKLGEGHHLRHREGFALTDHGTDLVGAMDQIGYCIKCHHQGKDSCSHGMREKTGGFKQSPFGVPLAGCPLEEKISEMHEAKEAGYAIGSLAVVTIDNPMCAATGHRICNDCMKGCIYQKQDPVDIPQVESRNLKDVLELPWGFEIYSLLTRWNPLNFSRPLPPRSTKGCRNSASSS